MRVASTLAVPGRGVSVVGVAEHGHVPPAGTAVSIWIDGRRTGHGVIAGGPVTEAHPPMCGLLLRGPAREEVPPGARISSDS